MSEARELLNFLGDDDTAGFDFERYFQGEQEILKPALWRRGYTDVRFYMIESDSFGPLIRGCKAVDEDGKPVEFFYG